LKGITKRLAIALFVVALFAVLFLFAHGARAQQTAAAASPEIKQEVPDNPVEHAPPDQPLPYSHKTHAGTLSLPCATCHTNPDPGNLMTFPTTEKCMSCHHAVATKKPSIKKLAAISKSGQPIPWVRVYKVLPGVTFTHRKHLEAGLKCQMCHGQVQELDRMAENTSVTTMGVCLKCHQDHGAPVVCQTCHSWPPAN
jgi:Cytochrome c7 and related cytochrome c